MGPRVYPLQTETLAQRGYRVFPDELENDAHTFFHATAAGNLDSIVEGGMLPGSALGRELTTISYAPNSMIALNHWTLVRAKDQDGVILALRFETLGELFLSEGTHYSLALDTACNNRGLPDSFDLRAPLTWQQVQPLRQDVRDNRASPDFPGSLPHAETRSRIHCRSRHGHRS